MSVLESIIRFKEQEDAKVRADIGMIGNAFAAYQQGRQNNLLLQMEKKKLDVDLGTKGLRFDTEGNIVPATDLIESLSRGQEWKPRTKEEAFEFEALKQEPKGWKPQTQEQALEFEKSKAQKYTPDEIGNIVKQFSAMGDTIPPGTTVKLGDFTIPLNPKLTQEQALSVAASTEVEDDVNSLKELLAKKEGSPGIIAKTKLPYWMIGGDTEEIKRLRDQLAARIPFAKGGKQLTPFEAKTLFVLLPQPGQELGTINKNLDKFVREFKKVSEIAKKGTAGTVSNEKQQKTIGKYTLIQ